MRSLDQEIQLTPGSYVLHPPGELHEFTNGIERTVLYRVRFGDDMSSRHYQNRSAPMWSQSEEDAAYFASVGVPSDAQRP